MSARALYPWIVGVLEHVQQVEGAFSELADRWIVLAATATVTQRIRLGTMVTPLPRRRVIKLAWETVTFAGQIIETGSTSYRLLPTRPRPERAGQRGSQKDDTRLVRARSRGSS